jgi:hypothetical protein
MKFRSWLMVSAFACVLAVPTQIHGQMVQVLPAETANAQDAALKKQIDDLAARVTALEKGTPKPPDPIPPVVPGESADLTTVPPAASIVDAAKGVWTIIGGQVALNGKPIAVTHDVVHLKYVKRPVNGSAGGVFQQTNAGWWGPMNATAAGVPQVPGDPSVAGPPTPIPPTPPTAGVPAEAAKVGYTTQTFGPLIEQDKNWFYINGGPNTKNADGSVTIAGGPGYSDNLQTMVLNGPGKIRGIAFGCGMFVHIVMKYTGPPPYGVPVPAFWFNDWQNQDQAAYGTGASQWPGQVKGFVDSLEWDMGEINNGYGSWGFTIHNWFGQQSQIQDVPAQTYGSPVMGLNAQDGNFHTYDGLWKPATASEDGYIQHWFDGRPAGSAIKWKQYSVAKTPPPRPGDNAWARMDVAQHYGILGTGAANPMTVKEYSVYQGPGACNKTQ